jgi:hypothetical protein
MNDEIQSDTAQNDAAGAIDPAAKVLPLPGLVAIGLYMLVLAAVVSFGVISGNLPRFLLILVPVFVVASFGVLRLFRWAWALTLAAVFLLFTYDAWLFLEQQQPPAAVQGLLNLVIFFYLVRPDVRNRLR